MSDVQDLKQCFTREFEAKPVKTPKKKAKAVVGEEEDAEPEAIEVLTDVLLALLAKPSALLRVVCEHVFRIYCDQLTSAALDLILQVRFVSCGGWILLLCRQIAILRMDTMYKECDMYAKICWN